MAPPGTHPDSEPEPDHLRSAGLPVRVRLEPLGSVVMPRPPNPDFDRLTAREAWGYLGCSKSTFIRARHLKLVPPPTPTLGGDRWTRCDLDEVKRKFEANPKLWRARLAAMSRKKKSAAGKAGRRRKPAAA